jgi:hypothetical protein
MVVTSKKIPLPTRRFLLQFFSMRDLFNNINALERLIGVIKYFFESYGPEHPEVQGAFTFKIRLYGKAVCQLKAVFSGSTKNACLTIKQLNDVERHVARTAHSFFVYFKDKFSNPRGSFSFVGVHAGVVVIKIEDFSGVEFVPVVTATRITAVNSIGIPPKVIPDNLQGLLAAS